MNDRLDERYASRSLHVTRARAATWDQPETATLLCVRLCHAVDWIALSGARFLDKVPYDVDKRIARKFPLLSPSDQQGL